MPVALAILAVVVLPLVGVFAWSWFSPVVLTNGNQRIAFGYEEQLLYRYPVTWIPSPRAGVIVFELPHGPSRSTRPGWGFVWEF